MTVFIMDRIAGEAVALLREQHEVVDFPEARSRDWQSEATALIVRTFEVRQADIERAARLRIVAKHGTGVDNIDVQAARHKGIVVTNTPGVNANAVAEYVLGLALAVSRGIALADRNLRLGAAAPLPAGLELHGKTLGLVGIGDIGARDGTLFRNAFAARVIAFDPFAPDAVFQSCGATRAESLATVLQQADVVSLHVPLREGTRHLIGAAQLAMMKRSAILLNAARGGIVDEAALHAALVDGVIAGAGADVFEEEPPPSGHPLLGLPNFVATSHIAGSSHEALRGMAVGAARAVLDCLAGREPLHAVRG